MNQDEVRFTAGSSKATRDRGRSENKSSLNLSINRQLWNLKC
jgi:hypothetical protein